MSLLGHKALEWFSEGGFFEWLKEHPGIARFFAESVKDFSGFGDTPKGNVGFGKNFLQGLGSSYSSATSSNSDPVLDDNFWTYLDGLFTAQGTENAINRDYNSAEAALNRGFQASEAEKQRQWYSQMSSSAYQRAVQDLKAAGLNPILAAGGSMAASSSATQIPAGSSASFDSSGGDSISNIISSLAQVMSALGNNTKGKAAILGAILKFVK